MEPQQCPESREKNINGGWQSHQQAPSPSHRPPPSPGGFTGPSR